MYNQSSKYTTRGEYEFHPVHTLVHACMYLRKIRSRINQCDSAAKNNCAADTRQVTRQEYKSSREATIIPQDFERSQGSQRFQGTPTSDHAHDSPRPPRPDPQNAPPPLCRPFPAAETSVPAGAEAPSRRAAPPRSRAGARRGLGPPPRRAGPPVHSSRRRHCSGRHRRGRGTGGPHPLGGLKVVAEPLGSVGVLVLPVPPACAGPSLPPSPLNCLLSAGISAISAFFSSHQRVHRGRGGGAGCRAAVGRRRAGPGRQGDGRGGGDAGGHCGGTFRRGAHGDGKRCRPAWGETRGIPLTCGSLPSAVSHLPQTFQPPPSRYLTHSR